LFAAIAGGTVASFRIVEARCVTLVQWREAKATCLQNAYMMMRQSIRRGFERAGGLTFE
jgi:hypothetical protein